MKTILITACLIFINFSIASAQTYLMSMANASQPNITTFEFDINIKSTNTNFVLTSYQSAFTFNVDNSNGNLSFSYIPNTSELSNIPVYAVGINNKDGAPELTFASSAGKDTIKSADKRIGRFRLVNSLGFTNTSFIINWNFTGSITTILTGLNFTNITNPANHTNLSFTPIKDITKLSLTVYPLDSNDDAYLTSTGIYRNTEYSYMGKISGSYCTSLIRFPNTGILAGKIIDSAFVFFTAYGNSKFAVNIRIAANDTASAQSITSNRSAELGRVLTTAKVDWNNIPNWQSGKTYQSPDLKTIIQEWASIQDHKDLSDAILLFFTDNSSNKNGKRVFGQWDYTPAGGTVGQHKPKLVIYYRNQQQKFAEISENEILPEKYELYQNYPNPFNPITTIQYQIPQDGFVSLKVYDMLGSEITTLVDEQRSSGTYKVNFEASNLASGAYIYAVKVNDYISTKKMILVK